MPGWYDDGSEEEAQAHRMARAAERDKKAASPAAAIPVEPQASESELPPQESWKSSYFWMRDQRDAALAKVRDLEQEVARLRDSHGNLLEALNDLLFYSNGLVEETCLRDAREASAAAEKIAAPSERGKG